MVWNPLNSMTCAHSKNCLRIPLTWHWRCTHFSLFTYESEFQILLAVSIKTTNQQQQPPAKRESKPVFWYENYIRRLTPWICLCIFPFSPHRVLGGGFVITSTMFAHSIYARCAAAGFTPSDFDGFAQKYIFLRSRTHFNTANERCVYASVANQQLMCMRNG